MERGVSVGCCRGDSLILLWRSYVAPMHIPTDSVVTPYRLRIDSVSGPINGLDREGDQVLLKGSNGNAGLCKRDR